MKFNEAKSILNRVLIGVDQKTLVAYRKILHHSERQEFLHKSALEIIRRYQRERDYMIRRIELMAQGAYRAWYDQFISSLPNHLSLVIIGSGDTGITFHRLFFNQQSAVHYCLEMLDSSAYWQIIDVPIVWKELRNELDK